MPLSRVSDTVVLTKPEYTTVLITDEVEPWKENRFDLVQLFAAKYLTDTAYRATKIRIKVRAELWSP